MGCWLQRLSGPLVCQFPRCQLAELVVNAAELIFVGSGNITDRHSWSPVLTGEPIVTRRLYQGQALQGMKDEG
jgi:hypothetical protein